MNYDPDATPAELLPGCPQSRSGRRARETGRLGDVVQQIVTRSLGDGHPDVHSVATMLGLSTRTLQRRLSEEGVTYARVVARARCDVAQRMLEDPACKAIEVALDLGYSDPAHFSRAFVRWTDLAPREFRRLRATGRADSPGRSVSSCGADLAPHSLARHWFTRATRPGPLTPDAARSPAALVLAIVGAANSRRRGR